MAPTATAVLWNTSAPDTISRALPGRRTALNRVYVWPPPPPISSRVKPAAAWEVTSLTATRVAFSMTMAGPPGVGVSAHSEPSGTLSVGLQLKVTATAHSLPPPRGAAASAEVTHSACPGR